MQLTVTTIIFGLPTGPRYSQVSGTLPCASVTVDALIAWKIQQEVTACIQGQQPGMSGEYLPPDSLLAPATARAHPGTVPEETVLAQHAFAARAYMIVVDDRRVVDPTTVLHLTPTAQVEFIKILPLVGG